MLCGESAATPGEVPVADTGELQWFQLKPPLKIYVTPHPINEWTSGSYGVREGVQKVGEC